MGIAERKAREFERREREILNAAFKLFMEKGPDAVTNEMIARASEIGKGTIYKHFKSKNDIYAVLLIEQVEKIHRFIKNHLDSKADVIDQMSQFMLLHLSFYDANPGSFKICYEFRRFITDDSLDPAVAERYEDMYRRKNFLLQKIFEKALDMDLVIDLPPADLTILASGMFLGAINEMPNEFISSREVINATIVESVIKSLLK
ncbi:MAG: TetR/AcrR family transcriptional regulator [Desulfobacteraceae bacterium]|nr:TetR/AcrR family transcriptional regulator [Desulfobacteraceae bacterium]